jgi:hypothetical protein
MDRSRACCKFINAALEKAPTDFIQQIESILAKTQSSWFVGPILGMFNVSDIDLHNIMKGYIDKIKANPKYRYLQNSSPQMQLEFTEKQTQLETRLASLEKEVAALRVETLKKQATALMPIVSAPPLSYPPQQRQDFLMFTNNLPTSRRLSSRVAAAAANQEDSFDSVSLRSSPSH